MTDETKEPLDDENIEGVDIPEKLPSDEELYGNDTPLVIPEDECVYGGPITVNEHEYIIDSDIIGEDGELIIPVDIDADVYGPAPEVGYYDGPGMDPGTGQPWEDPVGFEEAPEYGALYIFDEPPIDTEVEPVYGAPYIPGDFNSMGWQLGEQGPIDFDHAFFTSDPHRDGDEDIDDSWCPDDVPEA